MIKIKLFVVISILSLTQNSAGSDIVYQNPFPDSVRIIEKVYLHVDRDSYYPGDDIWFKAYLIDALDRSLTNNSRNLHVELISSSLKIISGRIIRLENGTGHGDFRLPDGIASGRYMIRAYTNYMRNFGDQLFFSKEIFVINSSDSGNSEKVKYAENKTSVSFFPEGGSLLHNVSSIVAFKATNYQGKGCDVSGKVFSSKGELITSFKSTHLGMGTFFLRPAPGESYYSITRGSDSTDTRTDLPSGFPTGLALNVSINQNNELVIITKTNSETLQDVSDDDLVLNISIRHEVFKSVRYRIKSSLTSFSIPTDDLPDGILMLTLSDADNRPLSERLVYIEREAPLKIKIKTDKALYNKRELVSAKVSLSGDSTSENDGNFSFAVVDKNFTENTSQFPRNISSWFLLESDIRGNIEDPSYYFDPSKPDRLRDLDLLLRTQGWRDFAWKYDSDYFSPENGFTVSGKLKRHNRYKTNDDARVSIAIFGDKINFMKSVPVDSTGKFRLSGIDLTGEGTLIATGIGKKDHPEGILTLDSVKYDPAKISDSMNVVTIRPENSQDKLKSYYRLNEDIRKKYKLTDTINLGEVNIVSERHKDPQTLKVEDSRLKYGKPEAELVVTEQMLGYNTMLQLLKGKIPGLLVIGDTTISIRGYGSLEFNKKPLILIDGNQVTFEDLVDMPIPLVDRIDVLKSISVTSIYGFNGASGVINVITKAGGVPAVYKPVEYSSKLRISGYYKTRIFYSPQHLKDPDSDLIPDLRSTLYWNPDINLRSNQEQILNYYNGDNSSLVRIIAEGITSTGIPVTGEAEYEVR
jgi:hypothetical protein